MGVASSKSKLISSTPLISNSSSIHFPSSNQSSASVVAPDVSSVNQSSVTSALPPASATGGQSSAFVVASPASSSPQAATSNSTLTSSSTTEISTSGSTMPAPPSASHSPGTGDDSDPTSGSTNSSSIASSSSTHSSSSSVSSTQGRTDVGDSSSSPAASTTSKTQAGATTSANPGDSTSSPKASANGILIPSNTLPVSSNNLSKGSSSTSNADGVQGTPSKAGSTSVRVVTSPSSTVTGTITEGPASTLSTPVGITTVSSGHTQVSFPALVTFVSTSTEANGALTTWTSILANPTNAAVEGTSDKSFLHNEGAVAGVFTVVGILASALAICSFLICRRRRRRNARRHQWIDNIQKRLPAPDTGLESPSDAPAMRSLNPNDNYYHFETSSPHTARPFFTVEDSVARNDDLRAPRDTVPSNSLGLMEATRISPFDDYLYPGHREDNPIGLAVTTNSPPVHQARPSLQSRPSFAQSSPSIYPPSLPLPNDNASVYEDIDLTSQPVEQRKTEASATGHYAPPSPVSPGDGPFDDMFGIKPTAPAIASPPLVATPIPHRPARSSLRETPSKIITDHSLVTPPSSLSGHGHGNADELERESSPSPSSMSGLSALDEVAPLSFAVVQPVPQPRPKSASKSIEDIVMRRTLLDVRPRPSRDSIPNAAK
ncbi:hypothetical protein BDP27DRAFT_1314137 [Rhodocollybia butyracea]|uniref:Uncharacterized protein n=1 Tax=Rhodocollybia butyracea TaxID=206335 RepID=A0A9P5Q7I7_9AGAR|nr:hypothetical protein BDP27DRAFT_1314137 [Rhodocollybia butyracea]